MSAIVGQEALVEALLVNAVAPEVGGVLVRGERGTAKSTAVRALAPLLPPVRAAAGQAFAFASGDRAPDGVVPADAPLVERPAPLVELPLGATLDRLVGALDLARALGGERAFEPGLLARAHRGILYVDEVNLLPDHLVDALLDAAASGVARVERDAVSVEHDARFLLVGTMNVEEGELRPQLLDRFGLGVEVRGPADPAERAEIVRRRLAFESDPAAFAERFAAAEDELAARISGARERLDRVRLPERELLRIAGACARLGIDGARGDIVCARTARALAALDGDDEVGEKHVRRAAQLALAHRRRSDPLKGGARSEEELREALDAAGEPQGEARAQSEAPPQREASRSGGARAESEASRSGEASPQREASRSGEARAQSEAARSGEAPPEGDAAPPAEAPSDAAAAARERRDAPAAARLPADALRLDGAGRGPHGRRARAAAAGSIDSRPVAEPADVAIVATLIARLRGEPTVRDQVRAGREGALLCIVVDASGSMGARRRLARVKGALLDLLREAYAHRDYVAIVAFRDGGAQLLVAPGVPLEQAADAIRTLPTGGRTPLAAGLDAATQLVRREHARDAGRRAIAVVLTDGRVADEHGEARSAAARLGRAASAVHVVDTEDGPVRLGLAGAIAAAAGGRLHALLPGRSAA